MTTVHSLGEGKGFLLCTKGAPDRILDLATDVYQDGMIKKLHREDKVEIQRAITTMAGRALRVLTVAMGHISRNTPIWWKTNIWQRIDLCGPVGYA